MAGRRRGATTVEGSLAYGGEQHTSPLWLLITAIIAGGAWFIFSTIQITGTIQAVLMFLQETLTVTPAMTAQDLIKMQQGALGSSELIANAIGWAVQIILLIATFPSEHYIAAHIDRARRFVMWFLIFTNWFTDMLFVLHGRTVFTGFLELAPNSFGILVIAIVYPIAVTAITVLCGVELAHRLDKLIHRIRGL